MHLLKRRHDAIILAITLSFVFFNKMQMCHVVHLFIVMIICRNLALRCLFVPGCASDTMAVSSNLVKVNIHFIYTIYNPVHTWTYMGMHAFIHTVCVPPPIGIITCIAYSTLQGTWGTVTIYNYNLYTVYSYTEFLYTMVGWLHITIV